MSVPFAEVASFRALSCLGIGLALASACGGTTSHGPGADDEGGNSSGGAGASSHAGTSMTGGKSAGGTTSVVAGASGRSNTAGTAAGGKIPDDPIEPLGGDSGQDPVLDCDKPYAGPTGGPRQDGPMPTGSCASIDDMTLLSRYDDIKARVPQGLYYEASSPVQTWELPCSNSVDETAARGTKLEPGTAKGRFKTDWFYEAEFCQGKTRAVYRNLRCDYFDGTKLANPTPENLAFLGSLLWWANNWSLGGGALLGYAVTIGDATDWVEMCTLETTFGDFGLCDELRLQRTQHLVRFGGEVVLGQPELVRAVKGKCR